jgi:hypothetical protein
MKSDTSIPSPSPVKLTLPHPSKLVDQKKLTFKWLPAQIPGRRRPLYRLSVFELRPRQSFAIATKAKPVYSVMCKTTSHHYPATAKALQKGKGYCWRVETCDENGMVLNTSVVQGFRFRPRPSLVASGLMSLAGPLWRDPTLMLPKAPFIYGHPVIWRPLSALPELETPEEGPGTTGPEKMTIFGLEAARIYLIEPYWQWAPIEWDYSYIVGCEKVLLQIAGPNGFQEPNSLDARSDAGVEMWYTGPVIITNCWGWLYPRDRVDYGFDVTKIDLQYTGAEHPVWYDLSVRTVALDAAGNQLGPASDHITVFCVQTPRIRLGPVDTEWTWGDSPQRRVEFTVILEHEFPDAGDGEDEASTIVVSGLTPHTGAGIANATLTNVSLTRSDGTEVGEQGIWDGKPAYFIRLASWENGASYTYTLLQERPIPDMRPWAQLLLGHFLHFTDLYLSVHCAPGLSPSTYICGDWLTNDNLPHIECNQDLYTASIDESGLDAIYELWTRPLSGSRRITRRTDDDEYTTTRDVQVEFRFTESLHSSEDFRSYLMRNQPITLVETCEGEVSEYNVRMDGWDLVLNKLGEYAYMLVRAVYNPPRMTLNWQIDRSNWNNEEGRWIEDIETRDYDIGH